MEQGCGLHVDNCLGGFYLSFAQRAGLLPGIHWNFSVAGVTSISVDIHKYGMAPKGVSVVGFATTELRRATFHPVTNLLGSYVTPTLQGSRGGMTIAAAWATLVHMGEDGYREMARRNVETHSEMKRIVRQEIQDIDLVCDAQLCIVPITSSTLSVRAIAKAMNARGWSLFSNEHPAPYGSIEVCVGEQHHALLGQWRDDLHAAVADVRNSQDQPRGETSAAGRPSATRAESEPGASAYDAAILGKEKGKMREKLMQFIENGLRLPAEKTEKAEMANL